MKILFWNTHKNKTINGVLSELIVENCASIVVLAEYTADPDELVVLLASKGKTMREYITIGCERIKIFGTENNVEPGAQLARASIQIINKKDILCCVHLQSKGYPDHDERRKITIQQIVKEVRDIETTLNTENTIIVGDFNVNPFDSACIGARNFHGIPVYEETKRKSRVVSGTEFFMFYNPMWNLLGDFEQPYGTFFYNGGDSHNTYWNIYDQVILRPSLRERFVDRSLKILTETSNQSLLDSDGHPDSSISDHLPIIFEIREEHHGEQI